MSERGHTRGQFLGAGAALSAGALASTWRTPQEADAQEAAPTPLAGQEGAVSEGAFGPDFDGESFFLELEGESGGFVTDVQGGFPRGVVLETPTGQPNQFKKHVSGVKFEEVSFKFAMTQQPVGLFDWISETLDRSEPRRSGVIKACDADFRVTQQGFFTDALITEIGFPALDAASKEPAYMSLKFTSSTKAADGAGTVPSGRVKAGDAGFKFALGGLSSNAPAKIDAFTVKQGISETTPGVKNPAKISIPNIKVALARNSGLSSWLAFYEDFLLEGNNSEADELNGTVVLTNSKGTKELAQMNFLNMGILAAIPVSEQIDGEAVRRVQAELYCEEIRFNLAAT